MNCGAYMVFDTALGKPKDNSRDKGKDANLASDTYRYRKQ